MGGSFLSRSCVGVVGTREDDTHSDGTLLPNISFNEVCPLRLSLVRGHGLRGIRDPREKRIEVCAGVSEQLP